MKNYSSKQNTSPVLLYNVGMISNSLGEELQRSFKNDINGRPCLLVMSNGREHEVSITKVGSYFVSGWIAHYLRLCLFENDEESSNLSISIAKPSFINKSIREAHKKIFVESDCFIKTSHEFVANISEISAIDLLNAPYFVSNPEQSNGMMDATLLIAAIPEMRNYYYEGVGFLSSPPAQKIDDERNEGFLKYSKTLNTGPK